MTPEQLNDIIDQFRLAMDKRHPDSMCQVSPRALAVALHHFEGMRDDQELSEAKARQSDSIS